MLRDLFLGNADVVATSSSKPTMPDVCNGRDEKMPVVVNAPLDFELRNLDPDHPYLAERGFLAETVKHFGLGYCNRGLFRNRFVIPIRNVDGGCVGYAGRVVDDRAVSETNPKYKLPPPRERDGKLHEFHKSELMYNLDRVGERLPEIIVVEGFPSVWWLWQHGWKNVCATMGADCSAVQANLIVSRVDFDGRVWVIADGDNAGDQFVQSAAAQIAPYRFVRCIRLKDGEQPTGCSSEDLTAMLSC